MRVALPTARLLVSLATVVAGVAVTGCSVAEPGRTENVNHDRPVRILVSAHSEERILLGEVYLQVLQEAERPANLIIEPNPHDRLDRVWEQTADLVIGCTGVFLNRLDPVRAEELAGEIADDEFEDPAHQTYREFMGALPGTLTAPDPSSAQGCADEARSNDTPDLPQSIVPVYQRDLFDREEAAAVAGVTRVLTTDEIATLVEDARTEGSVSSVVSEWLGY